MDKVLSMNQSMDYILISTSFNKKKMLLLKMIIFVICLIITDKSYPAEVDTVSSTPFFNKIIEELKTKEQVDIDLFVMSQCPYAVEAEKDLIPIINKFKGKVVLNLFFIASEDASSELISMHGKTEIEEDIRQLIISRLFPDQFLNYLLLRADNYETNNWQDITTKLGIEKEIIENNLNKPEFIEAFKRNISKAHSLSIFASPTIILNGERYSGPITCYGAKIIDCQEGQHCCYSITNTWCCHNGQVCCGSPSSGCCPKCCCTLTDCACIPVESECCWDGTACPAGTKCCCTLTGCACIPVESECCWDGTVCSAGTKCCCTMTGCYCIGEDECCDCNPPNKCCDGVCIGPDECCPLCSSGQQCCNKVCVDIEYEYSVTVITITCDGSSSYSYTTSSAPSNCGTTGQLEYSFGVCVGGSIVTITCSGPYPVPCP